MRYKVKIDHQEKDLESLSAVRSTLDSIECCQSVKIFPRLTNEELESAYNIMKKTPNKKIKLKDLLNEIIGNEKEAMEEILNEVYSDIQIVMIYGKIKSQLAKYLKKKEGIRWSYRTTEPRFWYEKS